MTRRQVLQKTRIYIKQQFSHDSTGHDFWHMQRVVRLAKKIAKQEKADVFIVEMAALLHDLDDYKLNKNHKSNKLPKAETWLSKINLEEKLTNRILKAIRYCSFGRSIELGKANDIESMIVQDADRLDAMGAIGITRAIATGQQYNRPIYDPDIKPKVHKTFAKYKKKDSTSINHFYEKLFLLKDKMNTKTAKKIAANRHNFMKKFLEEFLKEWKGKK